jgi:hypothetical protein
MTDSPSKFFGTCFDAANPAVLGLHMIERDPVAPRLPPDAQRQLVSAALDDGASIGNLLRERYPGRAPGDIASELGVSVRETDEQPWAGPFLRHADYRSRPPEIRLFRASLGTLDRFLAQSGLGGLMGIACARPVFIGHELYHHVEAFREALPLARRHAVTRGRFGPWRLSAPIAILSEIAAGACAQAILALRHHPALLDLVVLWYVAPAIAKSRAARLLHGCPDVSTRQDCLRWPLAPRT